MKKILAILFILSVALPAAAQQMLIDKSDNNNEVIDLGDLKEITFNGTTVNVTKTDGTTSSILMSAINAISFGDYTDIEPVKPGNGELVAYISGNMIAVNSEAGSLVTIYNVIGTQVLCTRLDKEYGQISIASLPKGIYIVKANNRTAKIVRR